MNYPSLRWWDHLTVPPPPVEPTPAQKEWWRKARFLSRFVLAILLVACPNLLFLLALHDGASALVTATSIVLLLLALTCNRLGYVRLAGSFCVLCVIYSDSISILQAHLMDVSLLPSLYFLSLAIMLAGALITPLAAFGVAVLNSVIMSACLYLLPQTTTLRQFTHSSVATVLIPPLILQLLTALVTFFLVRDLLGAIARADRAEEIVALKNHIIDLNEKQVQSKRQLEEGLQQIAQVHAQVANGDLSARVSLQAGTVLYAIAVPLNNLLNRAQRWKQERDLLQHELIALRQSQSALHTVAAPMSSSGGELVGKTGKEF